MHINAPVCTSAYRNVYAFNIHIAVCHLDIAAWCQKCFTLEGKQMILAVPLLFAAIATSLVLADNCLQVGTKDPIRGAASPAGQSPTVQCPS